MKTKSKNFKKFLLATSFGALALAFCITPTVALPNTQAAAVDFISGQVSNQISVSVYDKSNNLINSSSLDVTVGENTFSYYTASWKDISHFKVENNGIDSIATADDYNYQYRVIWSATEVENGTLTLKTDRTFEKDIIDASTKNKNDITKNFTFYVDQMSVSTQGVYSGNETFGEEYIKNGGWGVYQFVFNCNGSASNSNLYEVKTTKLTEITDSPLITASPISSNYSINNAYFCEFEGDTFKYIDRNLIRWKAKGEGVDGKTYVLLPKDIKNNESSILPDDSKEYVGNTFTFDFDIAGTWNIYCEIGNESDAENFKTSNEIQVSTITVVPQSTIIWIVVGAVAASAIILTVIIVVTKKKEKIW